MKPVEIDYKDSYLGSSPVKVTATNGANVHITVNVYQHRGEDTLRKLAEKIESEDHAE